MAFLETREQREIRLTIAAINDKTIKRGGGITNASEQLFWACLKELEKLNEIENNTKSVDYGHNIEKRKEEIYAIMKNIRKANTGKRNWSEFLAEKKADMLLPENIKGNKRLLGACGVASAVAVGVLLPMVAVLTGPLGVGAIAGAAIAIAVAAVVLFAVCKLLSAVFKGLFNWASGANKKAASERAQEASIQMLETHKHNLAPMSRSPSERPLNQSVGRRNEMPANGVDGIELQNLGKRGSGCK